MASKTRKYKVINDADYAIPYDKLQKFADDVRELSKRRFGIDADGDKLVTVLIVDRTRTGPIHYDAVPYDHKVKTPEEALEVEATLLSNLKQAVDEMDKHVRIKRYHLQEQKDAMAKAAKAAGEKKS